MARPLFSLPISSGIQGWDGAVTDNFEIFSLGPWPIREHTGNEGNLQSTFPANQFDRCVIMVNHTTLGWSLYASDGTSWKIIARLTATAVAALIDNSGGTANDTLQNIGVAYNQAEVANNFADLAAKVNAIRTALVNWGVLS